MDVHIRVDDDDADRQIRVLATALSDLSPFWQLVAPVVRGWWKSMFDTEGAFAGTPWQPLSPAYAAWKAQHYRGKGILQATGQTKQAASRAETYTTPTSFTMIIDDAGAAHGPVLQYHQEGDGVPKRPLVFGEPLFPIARAGLEQVADTWIRDLFASRR